MGSPSIVYCGIAYVTFSGHLRISTLRLWLDELLNARAMESGITVLPLLYAARLWNSTATFPDGFDDRTQITAQLEIHLRANNIDTSGTQLTSSTRTCFQQPERPVVQVDFYLVRAC